MTGNGDIFEEEQGSVEKGTNFNAVTGDDQTAGNEECTPTKRKSIFSRWAESMARHPWKHLLTALVISVALSAIGIIVGDFSIAADNAGWRSRGTTIANRHSQYLLLRRHWNDLFNDVDGSIWQELQSNPQTGWEEFNNDRVRRMSRVESPSELSLFEEGSGAYFKTFRGQIGDNEGFHRNLITAEELSACETDWYGSRSMISGGNLVSVWKINPSKDGLSTISALDSDVLLGICEAETNTLSILEKRGLCSGCPSDKCLPPYSLVFMVRQRIEGGFDLSCTELIAQWPTIQNEFIASLAECVEDVKVNYEPNKAGSLNFTSCPAGFWPSVVDDKFGLDNSVVRYTSSYFYTDKDDADAIYGIVDELDRASGDTVQGAYDTTNAYFLGIYIDELVNRDMALAMGSAFITMVAILVHTGSPWLTLMGLIQIILSFPLSYFFYFFVLKIEFFPFLNFIGVFVVFALGADDVFVAVDKWKNARLEMKNNTTEEVASRALPDAAYAMLLTTVTTAAAFFATTICPINALYCFAAFCGLLIVFDYIMNIFIVFPALCLYDKWLLEGRRNCCITFRKKYITREDESGDLEINSEDADESEEKKSLIHRILGGFYYYLHKFRWFSMATIIAVFVVCSIVTSQFGLPDTSDVALVPDDQHFKQNERWVNNLLSSSLQARAGSEAFILWGITPADTGNWKDPYSFTTLKLDQSFNPKSMAAQSFLVDFCDRWFDTDFALRPSSDYQCPINVFDEWLQQQSQSDLPDEGYTQHCGAATSVPVAEDNFDACIIAWSQSIGERSILQENGVVRIIVTSTNFAAPWFSSMEVLGKEWRDSEKWLETDRLHAPEGVNRMYHTSSNFWRYDTNERLLQTAYGAGAIALSFAAVILLVSSRSFNLTLFSVLSIGYVLIATIACLVGLGWSLGL